MAKPKLFKPPVNAGCYMTAGCVSVDDGLFKTVQLKCVTTHSFGAVWMKDGTILRCDERYTKAGKLNPRTSRYFVNGQRVDRETYKALERGA